MQLTGFQDRVAFVTGAERGIGQAVASTLLEAGCIVIASDVRLPQLPAALQDKHSRFHAHLLDVRDSNAVNALVDWVERRIGPIDLGANVAGVLCNTVVTETSDDAWRQVFAVNCDGVFHVCRALAQRMQPRQRGAMVTVSSNAAGVPRHAMAAYAASKAAATMFTRCLGLELAPHGVRCNIVAPGSTLTPMQTGMWSDAHGAERVIAGLPEQYKAGIPLRKLATPEDIANAVVFMLSEQAGHIAMSDLYVDGGATLRA